MNNMKDFGKRVQDLRKAKGMTQEDLAHRFGVSAQAVSKWETNQSYPDITLLPMLAEILGTTITFLFGEDFVDSEPTVGINFPKIHQGLQHVMTYQGKIACYSDKTVESTQDTSIKFTDGSTAEFVTKIAINKGPGSIIFFQMGNALPTSIDLTKTVESYNFEHCQNIKLTIPNCDVDIVPSQDDKTRVRASGSAIFLHYLKVEVHDTANGKLLDIGYNQCDENNSDSNSMNKILVELPLSKINGIDMCGSIEAAINNCGNLDCKVPLFSSGILQVNGSGDIRTDSFKGECKISINGAGDVYVGDADKFTVSINGSGGVVGGTALNQKSIIGINGSGNVKFNTLREVNTKINGSGNVSIDRLEGETFTAGINGSGIIHFSSGECERFDIEISGSGTVDASGVTTRAARVVLHHSGEVTIGRVLEIAHEQIKKKGTITVLQRG